MLCVCVFVCFFFYQAEDGIRDLVRSRGLGDVYKRQGTTVVHSPTGEVLREERRDGAGRLLARMDYSYDANGNRVTETETLSLIHI